MNLSFNKFGGFPSKQTGPVLKCCSSSAVDLRFGWSVPRSDAGSGWSLLLLCQRATKKEQKRKLLICRIPVWLRTSAVDWACNIRDQVPDTDSDYVMKKPLRCWLGAVPRYWKVVASAVFNLLVAENTSAPLAPWAGILQPALLLFVLFSCSWSCLQNGVSDFFYSALNLVAFKGRLTWLKKGYFRTFPNIFSWRSQIGET